jgi:hypothetical protein
MADTRPLLRYQVSEELHVVETRTPSALLADILNDFDSVIDFAMKVSMAAIGERTTTAGEWASIVFAKMCINAISARALAANAIFDHIAIVTICRIIMESMTLYFYLHEEVEPEQARCRELALTLHDTTSRIKLMRVWQAKEQYGDLIAGQESLRAKLQTNSFFTTLLPEQKKRLLSGEQFYVGGMIAAAIRAGWQKHQFIGFYNYFSAQAHAAPMSFIRFKQHSADFFEPSEAQQSLVGIAINIAEMCLLRVTMRHLSLSPGAKTKLSEAEVAKFEKQAVDWESMLRGETPESQDSAGTDNGE